jgi:hypothetical protein
VVMGVRKHPGTVKGLPSEGTCLLACLLCTADSRLAVRLPAITYGGPFAPCRKDDLDPLT